MVLQQTSPPLATTLTPSQRTRTGMGRTVIATEMMVRTATEDAALTVIATEMMVGTATGTDTALITMKTMTMKVTKALIVVVAVIEAAIMTGVLRAKKMTVMEAVIKSMGTSISTAVGVAVGVVGDTFRKVNTSAIFLSHQTRTFGNHWSTGALTASCLFSC